MNFILIFPKIPFGDAGILIGEILLTCIIIKFFLTRKFIHLPLVSLLVIFGFYYFLGSNVYKYLMGESITYDFLYFLRFLMFAALAYPVSMSRSDTNNLKKYIIFPFVAVALLSFIIFIYYFITNPPTSFGEILWGYRPGIRLIPIFGLTLDPSGLIVTGGGSGNLLASLCIIVIIIDSHNSNNSFAKKSKFIQLLTPLSVACAIATLSRSAVLTIFFVLFIEKLRTRSARVLFFYAFVLLIFTYSIDEYFPIFDRLINTFENDELDPSSLARIENYNNSFNAFINNIWFVLFGIGSNANSLYLNIGAPLIESFYLGLFVSTGVVGTAMFFIFAINIYLSSKESTYMLFLFKYLIYESIILWSIGGGDFWGPINLYITSILLGMHYHFLKLTHLQSQCGKVNS
nr:O-antigen ligase family protein [uncultured Limnohabitans sp.]